MVPPLSSTVARLSDDERELFKLLVAALRVSDYTNVVDDVASLRSDRLVLIERSMSEFFVVLTGLCHAAHRLPEAPAAKLKQGSPLTFVDLHPHLVRVFEVARRYKRMNPNKFPEYGQLVMILQDAVNPRVRLTGGAPSVIGPICVVGDLLSGVECDGLIDDNDVQRLADPTAPPAERERLRGGLIEAYGGDGHASVVAERCIRSVEDSTQFIDSIRRPIATLLKLLEDIYRSDGGCLAITAHREGAVLTHTHELHYRYVRESLILWDIIMRDIFQFWECVEKDMLTEGHGTYTIVNTGQGYHRMSSAPLTRRRMEAAVEEATRTAGGWVGIKVIHLGDRDVPNALVFIDKYTKIPDMLQPIVAVLDRLHQIFDSRQGEYPGLSALIAAKYDSFEKLRRTVLVDFFRHAFDGSGDDGGNCIDGRLTSAWNWTHELSKKSYYHAFVLAGFQSFN